MVKLGLKITRLVTDGDQDFGTELEMFPEKQHILIVLVPPWFV